MTVGVMLRSITSSEITEWMAYFINEQEVPESKTSTAAVIKAAFANRVVKKRKK